MSDDLVIIGAGAAGLATAIFASRRAPAIRVRCVDGARHIGAKILVSGGSRCNVTNRLVADSDFWGGSRRVVRQVLRAFPSEQTVRFFGGLGVSLHEEVDGKLFPDSNRSRTVLDALVGEARRLGVTITPQNRVTKVIPERAGFVVRLSDNRQFTARAVVLATGGQSLPKTGSDGFGYQLARELGHGLVPTTPGLAPLVFDTPWCTTLSGVSHPAEAALYVGEKLTIRLTGDWLWTHFGASGPLALNLSRHWHRAELSGARPRVLLSLLPNETFRSVEDWIIEQTGIRPRAQLTTALGTRVAESVAAVIVRSADVAPSTTLAHLSREERRRVVHALVSMELPVRGSRGYQFAEVTAGGIPLDEIDATTMQSRRCAGLYLVGEVLDVDGRLGGFNFQWAWSTGFVAGNAAGLALASAATGGSPAAPYPARRR